MAIEVTDTGVVVGVDADVDPLLAKVDKALVDDLGKAGVKGGKALTEGLKRGSAKAFSDLSADLKRFATTSGKAGDPLKRSLAGAAKEASAIIRALQGITDATSVIAAGVRHQTELIVRGSKEQTNALTQATNTQLREARNANAQEVVLIQQQTAAARSASSARLQSARFMYETLGRLEKGFGAAVAGTARTLVSALSRTAAGVTGALSSVFHRGNQDLTKGVSSSLHERESLFRSSFSRQEKIIRESVTRQEVAIAGLRKQTQTGVVGAANRSGLFGGLAIGFAALAAAKSTFTIGADFTRGLAVLQAQLDLTAVQMRDVRQLSIDLGNDITLPGVSALDAAQSIQILTKQFGSLGVGAVDAAEKAAKGTLQLARAAGVGAEDAASIIGSAVNVFGISADKAVTIADQITGTLAKAAGVSFADFQTAFIQGATVFENFVGPAEEANDVLLDFNTTLAVLAKNGIVGETAGAGLKQFFLSASKQSDKAIATQRELAKRAHTTGTVFFDAAGKARKYDDSLRIIRDGLQGYTDQQKQATLTTLFGVRSQTIASAIIKTSQEDYDALRVSIQKQGLAAKIAAAQNTGLKGALDALGSVVETVQILLFEKVNKGLGAAVLALTSFVNAVLFGEGAFATLRTLLLGIGTGIGSLLAIRTAVELFGLLTTSVSLLLTPFGALVGLFGLAGGAIALLAKDSPAVGKFFSNLRDSIGDLAAGPLAKVRGFIGEIVSFFTSPEIQTTANQTGFGIGRGVTDGIQAGLETRSPFSIFVQDKAIPALKAVVDYVQDTVIPALVRFGASAKHVFDDAASAVVGFYRRIQPTIQPAIDGFEALGRALGPGGLASIAAGLVGFAVGGPLVGAALAGITLIGTKLAGIFSGDFGDIRGGAGAAASGVGSVLGTLGKAIVAKLKPVGDAIGEFFSNIFTGANLKKFEGGFLTVVERVGFILGNLISNPKVVAAVGAIVAGAVVIGARFAEGFAKGVIDNIPDLFNGAASLIAKALFDPGVIAKVIVGAFVLTRVVGPLIASFRGLGAQGASAFGTGLRGALPAGRGFLSTLLGGASGAGGATKALDKELLGINNRLRVLGSTTVFGPDQVGQARGALRTLEESFTDAEKRGLEARDRLKSAYTTAGLFGSGASGILGGLKQIAAAFVNVGRTAASSLGAAFRNISNAKHADERSLAGLATLGVESGKRYGVGLVSGISNGLEQVGAAVRNTWQGLKQQAAEQGTTVGRAFGGAALLAVGGFLGGKAEGKAGGSGLLSALTAGLVGLSVGGPVVGAASAGAALIGAAFGRAGQKAEEARERVAALAKSIGSDLKEAVDQGKISADTLRKGLDFKEAANFDSVTAAFEGLGPQAKGFLHSIGADFKTVLLPTLKRTNGDVSALKESIVQAAQASKLFTSTFEDPFGEKGSLSVQQQYATFFQFIQTGFEGMTKTQVDFLQTSGAPTKLRDTLKDIGTIQGDIIAGFRDAVTNEEFFADPTKIKVKQGQYARLAQEIGAAQAKIAVLNSDAGPGPGFLNLAPLNTLNTALDASKVKAENLSGAIHDALNPDAPGSTFQSGLDSAILSLQGAFADLHISGDIFNDAAFRQKQKEFASSFESVINAGVTNGVITGASTIADVQTLTQPVLDAILAGVEDPEVRAALQAQFQTLTVNVNPVLQSLAESGVALDPAQLSRNPLGNFKLPVVLDTSKTKLDLDGLDLSQEKILMANVGHDLVAGLASGITNNAKLATDAASGVVAKVVSVTRLGLKISSPSKVFEEIGSQVGAGMAVGLNGAVRIVGAAADNLVSQVIPARHSTSILGDAVGRDIGAGIASGLADSTADISSAVSQALETAITTAISSGSRVQDAVTQAATGLFAKITGTDALFKGAGSSFDLTSAVAKITTGRNSLLSGFDSNAQRIFDVNSKDPNTLGQADKAIFGSDLFSLDVKDFFGASNIANFSSALDDIAALGETLLAQGRPAQEVSDTLQRYVDDLVATGVQLGFNRDSLLALADTLGLSDEALADFVREVNDLGSAAASTPAVPTEPTSQQLQLLARPIVNNIYLPTGDPHAAALTVANAQAYAGSLPGG